MPNGSDCARADDSPLGTPPKVALYIHSTATVLHTSHLKSHSQDAIPQDQHRVVRAIITSAQSSTYQRTTSPQRAAHTIRPLTLLDTHNVQILGPETQRVEDKKAGKVRRKTISQAHRTYTSIVTAARGAELGGADADIHTQDIRSRIRDVFTVRDEQGGRGRTTNRKSGEARKGDGGAAGGGGGSECACC